MCITVCKIDDPCKFDAGSTAPKVSTLGPPKEMGQAGRWEGTPLPVPLWRPLLRVAAWAVGEGPSLPTHEASACRPLAFLAVSDSASLLPPSWEQPQAPPQPPGPSGAELQAGKPQESCVHQLLLRRGSEHPGRLGLGSRSCAVPGILIKALWARVLVFQGAGWNDLSRSL